MSYTAATEKERENGEIYNHHLKLSKMHATLKKRQHD
jgi:hypothetical protein